MEAIATANVLFPAAKSALDAGKTLVHAGVVLAVHHVLRSGPGNVEFMRDTEAPAHEFKIQISTKHCMQDVPIR